MSQFKIKDYSNEYFENEFDSSVVMSYSYDSINLTLVVKFMNSSVYLYSGVPVSIAERFAITPSKGSFIKRQMTGYPYRLISHND